MDSLPTQLLSLGLTAASGAAVALLCDVYRVTKAALGIRRTLPVVLLDLVFALLCGLVMFLLLLAANGAELRLATFVGLAGGAAIYWWVFSPLVVWLLWALASVAVGTLRTAFALLWWLTRRPRPWGSL